MYPRRAVAFLVRRQQGELAYHENLAPDVGYGQVHYALGVVKNAQRGYLFHQPVDVLLGVAVGHSEEYHVPFAYL